MTDKERQSALKDYKQIKQVFCPYLKTKVVFNSGGFRHLIYKAGNKKRDPSSMKMRFKMLSNAVAVLKITTTLQEYQSETKELPVKEYGQKVDKITTVVYFGFIAIINDWKIKVIVKKIGQGEPFFWSVIPNWVTSPKRDKIFHKGSLEED